MITVFATPKPFQDHIGVIQRNAIQSWRALSPHIEIILFGDSVGCAEVATQVNAKYVPDVRCNEYGTPYLNDIFVHAQEKASFKTLCYINADIVLPQSFLLAVEQTDNRFKKFLMIGSRWDLDWGQQIDFSSQTSVDDFFAYASAKSERHAPSGIDYFVFTKHLWGELPDLLAGRAGFDNWLIWRARRSRVSVVDASPTVMAVHQNHDYSHHPDGRKGVFEGEEAKTNQQHLYIDGRPKALNILDATYEMTKDGVIKKQGREARDRYFSRLDFVYPEYRSLIRVARKLRNRYLRLIMKYAE